MRRSLLAVAVIVAGTVPAFAKYYVIQKMNRQCHVTDTIRTEPPKSPEDLSVVIGFGGFDTREEAEAHMKEVCKDDKGAGIQKK